VLAELNPAVGKTDAGGGKEMKKNKKAGRKK
jgi:hypothetical protein